MEKKDDFDIWFLAHKLDKSYGFCFGLWPPSKSVQSVLFT